MELVTQISITWLSLKWLVTALVLESRVELGLEDPTCPDQMELWHCTSLGWYKAHDPSVLKGS